MWLFALAVIAIAAVVAALAGGSVLLVGAQQNGGLTAEAVRRLPLWESVGLAVVLTLGLIGLGSAFKTAQLAGGGAAVARAVGARRVETDTTDPHARRLLNVVEEMAIAAGCPVPAVYVMPEEDAINAFAAGWSLDDAVIGVTRGAMRRLNRDELQGVVAHEFSHILHGDMRLNLRITGLVFGILVLSVIGAGVLRVVARGAGRGRYQRRDRGDNGGGAAAAVVAALLFGAGLYAVGLLGVFFARLIQAAVSRQREFLADAAAVQYTRNPEGIGRALLKVGGQSRGSRLQTAQASAFRHLFFGPPTGATIGGLSSFSLTRGLATHPPLPERIARLLPGWDGRWRKATWTSGRLTRGPRNTKTAAGLSGLSGQEEPAHPSGEGSGNLVLTDAEPARRSALGFIGEPTPAHLDRARTLIAGLSPALATAARNTAGAQAVVFALLSDGNEGPVAASQHAYLRQQVSPQAAELTAQLAKDVSVLDRAARLPLLDLTLPALKALHPVDRRAFEAHVDALIGADNRLELFEWALRQALWRHLIGPGAARVRRTRRLVNHRDDLAALLGTLARVGGRGSDPQQAFAAGVAVVPGWSRAGLPAAPAARARLTDAVDRLGTLTPADTRTVVHACAAAVAADGRVSVEEFELLRAVAETLDVPVPPLLPGQRHV